LPWNSTFNLTVENLTDRDPSFARLELNYDPFTGDPIGRTFKFGIKKKFG
jgi:iron complex outermembrane recepter protein